MNIVVLVKQVPDTAEIKLDPKTGNIIREGVESIINPDDRNALEAAVSLKEEYGGKVTVVSMGPNQAIDAVSEAMGMGADEGILLTDKAFAGADTWATSTTLGKTILTIGDYDLIICGRQAIDGDTAQIGPQVAEYLSLPHLSYVCGIEEIRDQGIVVKRMLEEGFERVYSPLPSLITVVAQLNRPRYANVAGLLSACEEKAAIKVWNAADIGLWTMDVGLDGSLTQVIKTFAPKMKREGEILQGDSKEAVSSLIGRLKENKVL